MPAALAPGIIFLLHRYARSRHSTALQDILRNICLRSRFSNRVSCGNTEDILCITLPKASSTACEVKFSEGIKLIKCFCRLFSCTKKLSQSLMVSSILQCEPFQLCYTQWDQLPSRPLKGAAITVSSFLSGWLQESKNLLLSIYRETPPLAVPPLGITSQG
jgi:hypothetical protein